MATQKEQIEQLAKAQAEQAEVNAGILGALQGISARLDAAESQDTGVTVEAPAKRSSNRGGKKSAAKPNTFGPGQVLRQGWGEPDVGDEVTYTRSGKNPGQSLWKVVSVDSDGTVHATKLGDVD